MVLFYILILNALWLVSVVGAAKLILWPAVSLLVAMLLLKFIYQGFDRQDIRIMAFSVLSGLIIDGVLSGSGAVLYSNKLHDFQWLPPLWIVVLWMGFGIMVKDGLKWLINTPLVGGNLMFIGAPLSYLSAAKFGAVNINNHWQAVTIIGIGWLLYFTLLVMMIHKKEVVENAVV